MTINKSDTFESEDEMKAQIKLHHDNSLKNTPNAHADHSTLSNTQVNGIQLNLKQLKGPNRSYYEFMDPTNGTFFMVYNKSKNPFTDHCQPNCKKDGRDSGNLNLRSGKKTTKQNK